MVDSDFINVKVDPVAEFLKFMPTCKMYVDSLIDSIKESSKNNPSNEEFYNQINLLTVIKLQLEYLMDLSHDSIRKNIGGFASA